MHSNRIIVAQGHTAHASTLKDQGAGCIDADRLDTIYSYYSILSATPRRKRATLFENEDLLESLWDPNSDVLVRYKGTRIFRTAEDVVEYFALANKDLNGGDIDFYYTDISKIECESDNSVFATGDSKVTSSFDGDSVSTSKDRFVFGNNSALLVQVDTNVPTAVNNIMLNSSYDRQWFCDTTALRCPGELYPYKDIEECYSTLAYIPDICTAGVKDNYTDGVLQGDTMGCRYLHLISAGLRPIHHCPHLRNFSEVCQPEECPSAVRLTNPLKVISDFDGGHAMWIRHVETAVLVLFAMLGLLSYMWYYTARRCFQRDITSPKEPTSGTSPNIVSSRDWPVLTFKNMTLSHKHFVDETDAVVLHIDQDFLGGCRMTCITGQSGSGKTSFIKLLCGFDLDHMRLTSETCLRTENTGLCPQSADMWPKEMTVKDALFLSCSLSGADACDFQECFVDLGLSALMDQALGTLSGGQLQRVNIAASVARPDPTVLFLDEPLSALDEENSLACLEAIRHLPVRHSFVMTVHNASSKIAAKFDRIIHLDSDACSIIERKGINDPSFRIDGIDARVSSSINHAAWSWSRTAKGCLILWYGQFRGFPMVEFLLFAVSAMGAIVVGFLARKSTIDWEDSYLPANEGVRVPFYIADVLVGMAFVTSFGGALIFANRERALMKHLTTLRLMNPFAYVATLLLFRSVVHGIIQAACWVFIAMPVLGFTYDLDIIFANTAILGFAWSGATFGAAISNGSSLYSAHTIMLMDVLLTFFSGVFFLMSRLYPFFEALHYINPLFYILSANSYIITSTMDNGCGVLQHPGECASGSRIVELDEITECSSLAAQAYNFLFVLVAFLLTCVVLRTRDIKTDAIHEKSMRNSKVLRTDTSSRSWTDGFHEMSMRNINASARSWTDVNLEKSMRNCMDLNLIEQLDRESLEELREEDSNS